MRNVMKKIIVILFLTLMLINNSLLMLVANAVDEIQSLIDKSKVKALTEVNLEKYVNYSLDDENKGVMLQLGLKSGIEYEEGQEYIPIKATGIKSNLPKVKDKFPEKIEVLGISTKATNGGEQAKDWQYEYNSENGEFKLVAVNNQDDNGNIYSENVENARDEYKVIAYYGAECYSDKVDKTNIKFDGEVQISLADDNVTIVDNQIDNSFEIEDNISGLISTNVKTSDIYNGFINSNKVNGTNYTTQYSENMNIDISYKNIADEVTISSKDVFLDNKDNVQDTDEIIYKSTRINKQNVLDILGEDGTLKVLNTNGDVLAEINKDSEASEDGFINITYQNELPEIVINLSEPVNLGTLSIENTKEIKNTMTNVNNNRVVVKNEVKANNNVEIKDEEANEVTAVSDKKTSEVADINDGETDEVTGVNKVGIYEFSDDSIIEIKNSETRVDVSLDKTEWTNNIQNEVVFTTTLVSNEAKYNLFKNPVIDIELPNGVDSVILGDDAVLYDDNFSVSNIEIIESGENKILRIAINGIQNQYIQNAVTDGIQIVIPATIIMKKDIESINTQVKYRYSNQNSSSIDYENAGNTFKAIDINVRSIMQDFNEGIAVASELDTNLEQSNDRISTEVIAQVGKDILGNNGVVYQGEAIDYIVRFKNKTKQTINNVKAVWEVPEGTTVVTKNPFYSDIPLEGEEGYERNELYTRHEDITSVEIKKDALEPGQTYEESFKILVDDLESGVTEKNISIKTKFYINESEVTSTEKNLIAKGAELTAHLYKADKQYFVDNSYRWRLEIDNLTDSNLSNVVAEVHFDKEIQLDYERLEEEYGNKVNYDENAGKLQIKFDNFEAKSEKVITLDVIVNKFEKGKYDYNSKAYAEVYAKEETKYRTDIESIETKRPYVKIVQTSEKEGKELRSGEKVEYNFTISNPSTKDTHIKMTDDLPNGINPISAVYECYELQDNDEFKKVNKEKDISSKTTVEGVIQSDFELETYLPAGESLNIKIIGEAAEILASLDVVNAGTISGDEIFSEVSNSIKNRVLYYGYDEEKDTPENPDNPNNPDDPNNPDNPSDPTNPNQPDDPASNKKYEISGVAWIDEDKDGRRTDNEKLFEGITVKLFDIETNKIVVDDNNKSRITKTDSKGYYNFKDVKVGKYIVLFEFDTDKYKLTTYHKNSISETANSDAVLKEVSIDGKVSNVGVTDTIDLYKDYENIDIGLVKNDEFDFKLDKYITKVTVSDSGNDKTYDYNNSKLAKVEVAAKKLATTVVSIEYKIVITNEGNTSGYVKQIIDYLPSDLKFNASSNDGWQKTSDNYLVNTNLANRKLNPGESQEVTLILTAQNVTKSITNGAEIGETYNSNELKDIDSTEANKDIKEDDYSEAEVIISIKTGIFINILKILLVIAIVSAMVFIIVKLKNKKFVKLFMMSIFVCGLIMVNNPSEAVQYEYINYSALGMHIVNGVWQHVHGSGRFWCISPGDHLCSKTHRYIVTGTTYVWSRADLAKIHTTHGTSLDKVYGGFGQFVTGRDMALILTKEKSPNKVSAIAKVSMGSSSIGSTPTHRPGGDSSLYENIENTENKILVGPYSFRINTDDKPSYKILDENNKDITSECEIVSEDLSSKTLKSNDTFYLIVPYRVKKVQLKVQATQKYSVTSYGYKITYYRIDKSGASAGYCVGNGGKEPQTLISVDPAEKTDNYEDTQEITWTTKIPKAKITINKEDVDGLTTNLKNTMIDIIGDQSDDRIKSYAQRTTMAKATTTLELIPGKYTIRESGAPDKYGYLLQVSAYSKEHYGVITSGEKTLKEGQNATLTLKNKQFSNLRITKRDDFTDIPLEGVEFYITYNNKYISNTFVNGSEGVPAQVEFTSDVNSAYKFKTDSNGRITVLNLPRQKGEYSAIECGLSEYLDKYYKVDSTPHAIKLKNNEGSVTGNWSDVEIKNKQEYIDITGFVWEDINTDNKMSTRDDLYNERDDKLVAGIPVELKKDGVTVDSLVTGSDGSYYFESKRTGTHGYREILVDEISKYSVEFTYNGLKYTSVALTNGFEPIQTSSKAAENQALRNAINTNFTRIDKDRTGTGIGLTYERNAVEGTSSLISKIHHTVDTADGWVQPKEATRVTADTKTSGYEFKRVKEHQYQVKHVNLGITLREQTDLAIMTDVNNINMMINGYTHTYNYKQRAQFENYMNNENDKSLNGYEEQNRDIAGYNALLDGFSVKAKKNDGNYKNLTYTREIYPSYIAHLQDNNVSDNDKLRVFVRYKIVINNQSSSLINSVNTLRNYCDTAYDLNSATMLMSSGREVDISNLWRKGSSINGHSVYEADLSSLGMNAGEKLTMYLTYELNRSAIISLTNNNEYKTATNTTEIVSYTTWDSAGNAYGSIDRDSAPDNVTVGDINTYEDDTDAAPELTLERSGKEKELTGIVFEDSYEADKNGETVEGNAKEALGNGQYENNVDNLVQGAKVRLLDSNNQPVTLYRITDGRVVTSVAENAAIGNNGKYEFVGLVPGVYYIEYEYGTDSGTRETRIVQTGKEVTTEEYKSTIIKNSMLSGLINSQIDNSGKWNSADVNTTKNTSNVGYWYLNKYGTSGYSAAIDDYGHRKEINEALSTVSYQVKSGYDGKTYDTQKNIYLMSSRTPYLSVAIENDQFETEAGAEQQSTYETKFGIVVRPRQKFEIMKEISYVKLTLANGQILLEGDPRTTDTTPIPYLTYPDRGLLKIEVDNEIIQGATLEIAYEMSATNLSALNYNNMRYYLYGNDKSNEVKSKIKLIDYLDKEVMKIDSEAESTTWKWEAKTKEEMNGQVSEETINASGDYNFYIPNNSFDTIEMSPGVKETLASIRASKLLSSSEDMVFDNIVEIYELYNPVGRFYSGTPGNYDFVKEHAEEDNNKEPLRATITVVPPTGIREIVIYSVVGVGCLVILSIGIVVIKKKVLE